MVLGLRVVALIFSGGTVHTLKIPEVCRAEARWHAQTHISGELFTFLFDLQVKQKMYCIYMMYLQGKQFAFNLLLLHVILK